MSPLEQETERRALLLFERSVQNPTGRAALLSDEPQAVRDALARLDAADDRARRAFPTEDDAEYRSHPRPLPTTIGNYRLAELIGEGGMGLVFAGERADGLFDHQVAIKLIHPHNFGSRTVELFARERRLLARLDHPHIARLIDGGVSEDGWPYIIMERVDGLAIDVHTVAHRLGLRARVALLSKVCHAVQAAHTALVVHGDIKPGNILVRADGTPRLLDFGVARLADSKEWSGLEPRTAAFCAPERLAGAAPTVASDIYALGVLLRLLCGRDGADPAQIDDRDLAAIAAQATTPDPKDRYASTEALRLDLDRWLDGMPVSARPASPGYLIARFVQRHRITAIAVLLMLFGLVAALIYAAIGWSHAAARAADLGSLAEYHLTDLDRQLDALPRTMALRADLARETQTYLDRLAASRQATPAMRRRAADGLRRLALLQGASDRPSLGDPSLAGRTFAEALRILPADDDVATRMLRSAILIDAAHSASGAGEPARASQLLGTVDPTAASAELKARYWLGRSEIAQWNGQFRMAIAAAQRARADIDHLASQRQARLLRTESYDLEAEARYYAGDLGQALAIYTQAERLAADNERMWPDDRRVRWKAARERWSLGTTLVEAGQARRALPLLRAALFSATIDSAADPDDRVTGRRQRVYMLALGQGMVKAGISGPGLDLLRRSVRLRQEWWRRAPNESDRRRDWTTGVAALGDALVETGQVERACHLYKRARESIAILASQNKLTRLEQGAGARELNQQWNARCLKQPI